MVQLPVDRRALASLAYCYFFFKRAANFLPKQSQIIDLFINSDYKNLFFNV